jgi:hypothetical protein
MMCEGVWECACHRGRGVVEAVADCRIPVFRADARFAFNAKAPRWLDTLLAARRLISYLIKCVEIDRQSDLVAGSFRWMDDWAS